MIFAGMAVSSRLNSLLQMKRATTGDCKRFAVREPCQPRNQDIGKRGAPAHTTPVAVVNFMNYEGWAGGKLERDRHTPGGTDAASVKVACARIFILADADGSNVRQAGQNGRAILWGQCARSWHVVKLDIAPEHRGKRSEKLAILERFRING